MQGKRTDLVGRRFGRLQVIEAAGSRKVASGRYNALWRCRCDCGNEVIKEARMLKRGRLKSCGCLGVLRHGHNRRGKRSPTYRTWANMHTRCFNKDNINYKDYGGRGITVCHRWWTFENFLADMGEAPSDRSLDRKDNDGNYEPSNCRWATPIEQANNMRKSRFVDFRGERMSVRQLAQITGLSAPALYQRIFRYGWTPEEAATTPIGR